MEAALKDMTFMGYQVIHVWPFAENLRAQKFYQKFGFTTSGSSRVGVAPEVEYIRYL